MIRLLAVLAAFLFMSLWFLGADHGQFIHPPQAGELQPAVTQPVTRPVFIPAQPVMQAGLTLREPPAPPAPPPPEPQLAGIKLMHVPGGASVRGGPGAEFSVIGDLSAGDVVMVIDQTTAPGWTRIRVDGRGEGWVASTLLRE